MLYCVKILLITAFNIFSSMLGLIFLIMIPETLPSWSLEYERTGKLKFSKF